MTKSSVNWRNGAEVLLTPLSSFGHDLVGREQSSARCILNCCVVLRAVELLTVLGCGVPVLDRAS